MQEGNTKRYILKFCSRISIFYTFFTSLLLRAITWCSCYFPMDRHNLTLWTLLQNRNQSCTAALSTETPPRSAGLCRVNVLSVLEIQGCCRAETFCKMNCWKLHAIETSCFGKMTPTFGLLHLMYSRFECNKEWELTFQQKKAFKLPWYSSNTQTVKTTLLKVSLFLNHYFFLLT